MDRKTNSRMTRQRRLILDILRSTTSHPTADWVYERAREKVPNISLGTVYRNLRVLKEQGEILELDFGSTYSRFDGNPENHYHFSCEECGRVYDIDLPVKVSIDEEAERASGFRIDHHRLEFYGTCADCLREEGQAR